ncbi:glycosyltransferase family 4 protein [Marinoscillum pacificum]|uniref:glycosyltransferase family 4 protein n=1 Tax=Marinoscillum pacificum TaxID=392723 RepID=UPI0021577548|nr:glycosyltransferase family 4 protein [Marinoscillum pacificum]
MSKVSKIFYFTPIASPFQLEFISSCNEKLCNSEIIPVFVKPLPEHRKHWGNTNIGIKLYSLAGSKVNRTLNLLNKENPDSCFLSSYTSLENWVTRQWCIKNDRNFFIGPVEPMNMHNIGLIKQRFRLIIFKRFVKGASGIAAMGNNALRMYRKVFQGKMINISYTFNHSKLLSKNPLPIDEPITFLYSGRLSAFRNPLLVIEAFAQARKEHPDIPMKLIMSGKGELYQDCIDLINSKNLTDFIVWMNEFNDWHEIHSIYSKAHVLLALQRYSTWGIIIQEAMASGMGIIASRTIEAADNLIIDEYNGYLISMNKDEAVKAMSNYIDNRKLIKLHGNRSKEVVKTVDIESQSKKLVSLFYS